MLNVFSSIPAPQWSKRLRNWNIFLSRRWKIFHDLIAIIFRWNSFCGGNLEHDAKYFKLWLILRLDTRDDNTLNLTCVAFCLKFQLESKCFQTSLNIFNLFQSSLFDKYFLLPSRYQYSPGANFYIKFSLTAEAIYRWHNVGIIELWFMDRLEYVDQAALATNTFKREKTGWCRE